MWISGRHLRRRLLLLRCTTVLRFLLILPLGLALCGCALKSGSGITQEVTPLYSAGSPNFQRAAGSLLKREFLAGNEITTLVNGNEIFPAMLREIRRARRSISFETYIFSHGEMGEQFAAAFAERAAAGVKVRAIFDAQGSKAGRDDMRRMEAAGVEVVNYHPFFYPDPRRFNNRTHRKLLIIDGKVGFIGGVGIADEWMGDAAAPGQWRENHYRVTGPVVAQMQAIFAENWLKTRGEVLHGPDLFPPLAATGSLVASAFGSSPRQGNREMNLMYLLAIASAQKTLRIENPYFLPDELTREALVAAARRGVNVEVLLPGSKIDQKLVRLASKRHWDELIEAGIKIYEYQPTMVHVKLLIVDDAFVSVGSANFDNRSVRLNDEANLNVLDRGFAARQIRLFEADKARSRQVMVKDGDLLSVPLQQAAGLAAPQL